MRLNTASSGEKRGTGSVLARIAKPLWGHVKKSICCKNLPHKTCRPACCGDPSWQGSSWHWDQYFIDTYVIFIHKAIGGIQTLALQPAWFVSHDSLPLISLLNKPCGYLFPHCQLHLLVKGASVFLLLLDCACHCEWWTECDSLTEVIPPRNYTIMHKSLSYRPTRTACNM